MTVLVVRHGETPWTRDPRVQGWAAVPLTERGREQARAAAQYLAGDHDPDRLVASDVRRAKETATIVADELALPVTVDAGWRERHFGQYQGFSDERYNGGDEPMEVGETVTYGESWDDLHDRVDEAWDGLDHVGETVVVVTHSGPVWRLAERLEGEPRRIDAGEVVVIDDDETVVGVVTPTDREP